MSAWLPSYIMNARLSLSLSRKRTTTKTSKSEGGKEPSNCLAIPFYARPSSGHRTGQTDIRVSEFARHPPICRPMTRKGIFLSGRLAVEEYHFPWMLSWPRKGAKSGLDGCARSRRRLVCSFAPSVSPPLDMRKGSEAGGREGPESRVMKCVKLHSNN